jgi:hypothetical protein
MGRSRDEPACVAIFRTPRAMGPGFERAIRPRAVVHYRLCDVVVDVRAVLHFYPFIQTSYFEQHDPLEALCY